MINEFVFVQEVPILPEHCPEQDEGLWGGEGVIKGYYQSGPKIKKKVLPRHWVPRLWFPRLKKNLYYSEVLNTYMRISTTERVLRLIDRHHGLDFYLLETPDIDINSRLGLYLKRQIFIELAKEVGLTREFNYSIIKIYFISRTTIQQIARCTIMSKRNTANFSFRWKKPNGMGCH